MTLEQVIVISKVKFAAEFWKKIFQAHSIKALLVDDYTDFAHFIDDLRPELVMVDLKLAQQKDFGEKLQAELRKAKPEFSLVFLGTAEEWRTHGDLHQLGSHLETPIALSTAVDSIKSLIS